MSDPIISVVMSVYNGERYLAIALESILKQTFEDFEFIIINDGSTDGSQKILEQYANDDNRIRLINQGAMGLAVSLNKGIALAKGQWIARMDADDIALPARFARQLMWLERTGDDLCGCYVRVIGGMRDRVWRYPVTHDEVETQLLFNSAFAHPAIIASSKILKQHAYIENNMPGQDYELWTRLALSGVRMSNCPEVLLKYRHHRGQISITRQESQYAMRNKIARNYWHNRGLEMPLCSIIKFTNSNEMQKLLSMLRVLHLTSEQNQIVSTAIWKLAMRSSGLGLRLYLECYKNGIRLGGFRSLALIIVCLIRQAPGSSFFDFFYRLR